jgi:hypothetical protein
MLRFRVAVPEMSPNLSHADTRETSIRTLRVIVEKRLNVR